VELLGNGYISPKMSRARLLHEHILATLGLVALTDVGDAVQVRSPSFHACMPAPNAVGMAHRRCPSK
jgi:hypothetical protein